MYQNNTTEWQNTSIPATTNSATTTDHKTLEWKVKLAFNIAILVVALVGNSLVLLVVHSNKTKQKTPHEYFICNLSISDIIFVLTRFIHIYSNVSKSVVYCKVFWPTSTITFTGSVYTVTAIALFRCRAILNPFKLKPSKRCIYGTIAGVWVLAHVCVIPLYVVMTVKNGQCDEIWSLQIYNKLYTVALAVFQYVIPLLIMAISYTKIVLYLKQHKIPQCGLDNNKTNQLTLTRKRDMEVIKISVIIVLLYTILTLPGQIAWISYVFENDDVASILFKFTNELFLLHSCCNPFVYGTVSREFRSQLVNVLRNIFCCICKRNRMRTVVVHKEQGQANNSFQELDMNMVALTRIQNQ